MTVSQEEGDRFRAEFEAIATGISPSDPNASKFEPMRKLLHREFGWDPIAAKWLSTPNNLSNRLGESLRTSSKKPTPRFALLMTSSKLADRVTTIAKKYLAANKFHLVLITVPTETGIEMERALHLPDTPIPEILRIAYPDMDVFEGKERQRQLEIGDRLDDAPSEDEEYEYEYEDDETDFAEYWVQDCARDTGYAVEQIERWMSRLRRKRQIVLQGPPGTGKTFLAQRLARVLVGGTSGGIATVQFHPTYSYEDFVQGIRPALDDGELRYAMQSGTFVKFCNTARRLPESPHVLIVDEMNRGNLSRVFGELFYLLEYRSRAVRLAQGGAPFSVPPNVHLIGTMNTADRSIALVDHALRRRFSFVFLEPDYENLSRTLKEAKLPSAELIGVLRRINAAIGDRNYHVGTSFFLSSIGTLRTDLRDIWEGEIEPYLDEYFCDQVAKVEPFRWTRLVANELAVWNDEAAASAPA